MSEPNGIRGSQQDAGLSRLYRETAAAQPPRELDARILDAARRELAHGRRAARRWMMPLAAAAVIVLSVGLTLFMSERGVAPGPSELASSPAPEPMREAKRRKAETATPAEPAAKRTEMAGAPGAAADRAEESVAAMSAERRSAPAVLGAAAPRAENLADVISVEVAGRQGAYEFNVGIRSPDRGCQQYADWWEVVSEDGRLLYRRVLAHSHVDEQPFVRSGGPVAITPDTRVRVRAHMNPGGYGGQSYVGSVREGFRLARADAHFARDLASQPPLPGACAF